MAYQVPPLPYDYDALEPHIDEATMKVHHDKHHQAYVDKANAALDGHERGDKPVDRAPPPGAPGGPKSRSRKSSRTSTRCPVTRTAPCATTAAGTRTTPSSGRS